MKKILAIVALFVALMANAVSAESVLDKVAEKLTAKKTLTATFRISNSVEGVATGEIALSGDKFVFDAKGIATVFDGTTQWTIDDSINEISITEPTPEEIEQINPFAIIKSYKAGYKPRLLKAANGLHRVELVPKVENSVKKIVIAVEPQTSLPKSLTLTMADGSNLNIEIMTMELGVNMPSSRFEVNKDNYPGYEIVDMR